MTWSDFSCALHVLGPLTSRHAFGLKIRWVPSVQDAREDGCLPVVEKNSRTLVKSVVSGTVMNHANKNAFVETRTTVCSGRQLGAGRLLSPLEYSAFEIIVASFDISFVYLDTWYHLFND